MAEKEHMTVVEPGGKSRAREGRAPLHHSIFNPASVRLGVVHPDEDKLINILIPSYYFNQCV